MSERRSPSGVSSFSFLKSDLFILDYKYGWSCLEDLSKLVNALELLSGEVEKENVLVLFSF